MKALYLGLALGSSWSKAVLLDADGRVAARVLKRTGIRLEEVAEALRDEALATAGASTADLVHVTATGYGRRNVPFADSRRTEISCYARGAWHHVSAECDVVDIGGQDNKIIHVRAVSSRAGSITLNKTRLTASDRDSGSEVCRLRQRCTARHQPASIKTANGRPSNTMNS